MESRSTSTWDEERLLARIAELNAEVHALHDELERTQRLATLGMLAGSIAHEFNNILTPVMSYSQLALSSPTDSALTTKALQRAVDGTEKAASIASAMLGFLRSDRSQTKANVRYVASEALRCIGRDLAKDGIAIDLNIAADIDVCMRELGLEQVLVNLILNAVEAIRPNTGRITISARPDHDASGAQQVIITIDDSGCGISPEHLEKIFEPFYTNRSGGGERRGTGLGLSICKRLIEECGGEISATSRLGAGTTFTIRLPRAEPQASPPES